MHALPSVHVLALLVYRHPEVVLQESSVQTLPSVHTIAVPGMQEPPLHASLTVHTLPSEHEPALACLAQLPPPQTPVLHVSVKPEQSLALPAWHEPALQ